MKQDFRDTIDTLTLAIAGILRVPNYAIGDVQDTNYANSRGMYANMKKQWQFPSKPMNISHVFYLGKKFDFQTAQAKRNVNHSVYQLASNARDTWDISLTRKYAEKDKDVYHDALAIDRFFVVTVDNVVLKSFCTHYNIAHDWDDREPFEVSMEFTGFRLEIPRAFEPKQIAKMESSVVDNYSAMVYSDWLEERGWQKRAEEIRQKWSK